MSSIYKKRGVYYLSVKVNGRWKGVSLKTKKLNEAHQRAHEMQLEYSGYKSSELLNMWLERNGLKSKSYRTDAIYSTGIFIDCLGDKSVNSITKTDLHSFIHWLRIEKGFTDSAIGIRLRTIKAIFNFGYRNEILNNQPFKNFQIPTTRARTEFLSLDEIRKLLTVAKECELYSAYIEFLLTTGCRVGEFKNLKWEDIKPHFIEFNGKSGLRKFPNTTKVKKLLEKIDASQSNRKQYVFLDQRGRYIGRHNQLTKIVKRYIQNEEGS